jgi:hypothetical protein
MLKDTLPLKELTATKSPVPNTIPVLSITDPTVRAERVSISCLFSLVAPELTRAIEIDVAAPALLVAEIFTTIGVVAVNAVVQVFAEDINDVCNPDAI